MRLAANLVQFVCGWLQDGREMLSVWQPDELLILHELADVCTFTSTLLYTVTGHKYKGKFAKNKVFITYVHLWEPGDGRFGCNTEQDSLDKIDYGGISSAGKKIGKNIAILICDPRLSTRTSQNSSHAIVPLRYVVQVHCPTAKSIKTSYQSGIIFILAYLDLKGTVS
jgi:hypothetical protein